MDGWVGDVGCWRAERRAAHTDRNTAFLTDDMVRFLTPSRFFRLTILF
jgi:hypothetical protein